MKVLILGCGYVGSALGALLTQKGYATWGARRGEASMPEGVTPLRVDVTDPATYEAIPTEITHAVYCASPGGRDEAAYRAVYVEGVQVATSELVRRCPNLERVLLVTSTSVYGQIDGSQVDEESPTEPSSVTGRIILEGEKALHGASNLETASVRLGGIYGPGRRYLIESVRTGQASCARSPVTYTNRIHRDDCAGVLAHLLTLESIEPVYVGVDDDPAPRCEVLDWLGEQLGVGPVARTDTETRTRGGNKRCSNARLKASGYEFTYPSYRDGYAMMLKGDAQ